jgi:hypothetical protein
MILRHLLISLVVGALFGWALSTKYPSHPALIAGAAAAAFMAGSLAFIEQSERRTLSRRVEASEDRDA